MNNLDFYLIIFVIINFIIIFKFHKIKVFHLLKDKPDKVRKFHLNSVPLAGGLILIINIILFFILSFLDKGIIQNEILFNNEKEFYIFSIFLLLIFNLGYLDDKLNLSANIKFTILIIGILMILFLDSSLVIEKLKLSFISEHIYLSKYATFFTLFCFVVFINAFNMFDGINLQSSFYSLIILTFFLIFYLDSLFIKVLIINFVFFSYLNYRNFSFLGNSGSLLTAFIMCYLFIKLYNLEKIKYADEIFIFMIVPGLDMIRLFFKRILLKRNPFTPDRLHLHHILVSKFSHIKTILILCSLILFPIIAMYLGVNKLALILSTICVYSVLIKNN